MEQTAVVFEEVARLADAELIVELQHWVRASRSSTALLLVHLGEVDARGLYRERAWPSMFAYAVEELRMSESEAYARIAAARLGRRFPRVVALLAQGSLHLTAIKLLGPHLTADNHVQVLERARGKLTSEIALIVAELSPKPDAPSRIRKLPAPGSARAGSPPAALQREVNVSSAPTFAGHAAETASSGPMFAERPAETARSAATRVVAAEPEQASAAFGVEREDREQFQLEPAPRNVSSTTPLRPGRYKVEFTAGEAMHCKLEQLKALLRHRVPDGNLAIILERAADLLLEKTRKERFAQTTRPRVSKVSASMARASEAGAHEARVGGAHSNEASASAAHTNEARASGLSMCGARTSALHTTEAGANTAHAVEASAKAVDAHEAHANVVHVSGAHASGANASKSGASDASAADVHGARPGKAHSRYIPRAVVREVYARDGQQCTFVSSEGKRCPERGFLERHHHSTPYARGGAATAANLRIVCRAHNGLFAERDFGRGFMHSKLLHARRGKREG